MTQQIAYSSYRERERGKKKTRLWSVVLVWCQSLYKTETLGWLTIQRQGARGDTAALENFCPTCGLSVAASTQMLEHQDALPHTNNFCPARELRSFLLWLQNGKVWTAGNGYLPLQFGICTLKPEEDDEGKTSFIFQTDCAIYLSAWHG